MAIHDDAPLYEIAASEIASGKPDRGIFAKAFSAALGDKEKSRALYIQYRVEQLKEQLARRAREKVQVTRDGRKVYLAELKARFGYVLRMNCPESSMSSDAFLGDPRSMAVPICLPDVSEALGMLEFRLVDAVKAGLLDGVLDRNGDWWLSPKNT